MADRSAILPFATTLTAAFLASNRCTSEEAIAQLKLTFDTLVGLVDGDAPAVETSATGKPEPAVTVRKSLGSPDHIISMIDGKPYKTLRRHLTTHGYTPESYREAFDLKPDYPMVAPNYSEARKAMALKIGLGRKPAAA